MKMTLTYAWAVALTLLSACSKKDSSTNDMGNDLYFEYTVDGSVIKLNADNSDDDDIMTSYNEFNDHREFKIFAGKDTGSQLLLTLIADMSKPSNTANGSPSTGFLSQGSLSLQDYPDEGYTFNNYDIYLNPDPAIIPDAIVVSKSELFGNNEGRIITGTFNTTTFPGSNRENDPKVKPYVVKGKFRIKHTFSGIKF